MVCSLLCYDEDFSREAAELPTGARNGRTHQCGSGFVEMCTLVQSEQSSHIVHHTCEILLIIDFSYFHLSLHKFVKNNKKINKD
jgi:hypothetical protein